MNREIKFRFWGKYGDWLEDDSDLKYAMIYGDEFAFEEYEPVNDLFKMNDTDVMQYTGLKDDLGKEIYEGDLCQDEDATTMIVFESGSFVPQYKTIGGKWKSYGSLERYLRDFSDVRVLGNIYENPELLED